jgi:hypothetical protein
MLIYAYYHYHWIENTEVSKTVWIMSVSITELIGQAIFQTGSGNSGAGRFWSHRLSTSKQDMDQFALPPPSTRCQQSVECGMKPLVWCLTEWEGNESLAWQNAISWLCNFLLISPAFHDCRQKRMLRLERYWIYMKITSWRLILYLVWPVYSTWNITFWSFRPSSPGPAPAFGHVN